MRSFSFHPFGLALVALLAFAPVAATAQDQKVIVTVNDKPVTSYDIQQRINIWKLLGDPTAGKDGARKRALNDLIDDYAKIETARKSGFAPSDKEVDERITDLAKGLKTDEKGMQAKLKAQRISVLAMRHYLAGQMSFGRLVRGKYKENFSVTDAEINKKLASYRSEVNNRINAQIAKIEADPRRRPITVYELLEVRFPIVGDGGTITNELFQSRAIEVNQYLGRFKGCGSARSAASGIFNVKVGKKIEADASKLPKQMKQALDKTGVGRGVGPMRSPDGLQVLALCGVRKIVPEKIKRPNVELPSQQQVRGLLEQEKFAAAAKKYQGTFRKNVLIEFRDPAFGP
jgi:peptidyl-prolyl cis-trans isomerase SurA